MPLRTDRDFCRLRGRFLLWTGLVLPVVLLFASVFVFAPNAPWWDEFASTLSYLAYPMPERLGHIADFHNEHRLIFARLVFEVFNLFPGPFPFLWCIVLGDCLLLSYVAIFGVLYRKSVGLVFFVPFVWVFLDLANCENTLWALTAVQSHSVLLFAFASVLAFAKRASSLWFVMAFVFALLATASSASGLGIWPTLFLAVLLGNGRVADKVRDAVCISLVGGITIVFYMNGFFAASAAHTSHYAWSIARAVDFLLCFLGNVVPVASVARVVGSFSLLASAYILFRFKRIASDPIFHYFLYLHSITASGLLVRSSLPGAGLFYRFEIIAISLLCCEAFLLLRIWRGTRLETIFRRMLLAGIPVAILTNVLAVVGGGAILLDRKRAIESGYQAWPAVRTRLTAPDPKAADRIMQRYVDADPRRVAPSRKH